MHGAVLLDSGDEVVRSAIIWCDQRSEAQSNELEELFGRDALIRLTCNPPLTNFTLTKLLWVRENEPKNWARVAHVMLPKDYVRFRLTGERAIDVADASGTLLLDVANRRWSTEVLSKVGHRSEVASGAVRSRRRFAEKSLPPARMPRGCESELRWLPEREIRRPGPSEWALRAPARSAPPLGPPASCLPRPIVRHSTLRDACTPFATPFPGRWHVMGVTQAAGLSLRWFRDRFGSAIGSAGERGPRSLRRSGGRSQFGARRFGRRLLAALSDGRAHASSGSKRPCCAGWTDGVPHPRTRDSRRHGRRGLQPEGHVHNLRRDENSRDLDSSWGRGRKISRCGGRFKQTSMGTK